MDTITARLVPLSPKLSALLGKAAGIVAKEGSENIVGTSNEVVTDIKTGAGNEAAELVDSWSATVAREAINVGTHQRGRISKTNCACQKGRKKHRRRSGVRKISRRIARRQA